VLTGAAEYPKDVIERIKARAQNVYEINAFDKAKELGETRTQNVIMLGALSRFIKFPYELYKASIEKNVKQKFVELNLKAFEQGRKLAKK